jgi:hypothetical protein
MRSVALRDYQTSRACIRPVQRTAFTSKPRPGENEVSLQF